MPKRTENNRKIYKIEKFIKTIKTHKKSRKRDFLLRGEKIDSERGCGW